MKTTFINFVVDHSDLFLLFAFVLVGALSYYLGRADKGLEMQAEILLGYRREDDLLEEINRLTYSANPISSSTPATSLHLVQGE